MLHLVSSGTCNLTNSSTVYLTGEGRTFSTPGYPLNPGRGTCGWNITVPPGEFVKVTFWEMQFEIVVKLGELHGKEPIPQSPVPVYFS